MLPEHFDLFDHIFRSPKQVNLRGRVRAGGAGVGTSDADSSVEIASGQDHEFVTQAFGLLFRVGQQSGYADHGSRFALMSSVLPGLPVAFDVF